MEDKELLKAFEAIRDVAYHLLNSSNPHLEGSLKRELEPLSEVIEKLKEKQLKR